MAEVIDDGFEDPLDGFDGFKWSDFRVEEFLVMKAQNKMNLAELPRIRATWANDEANLLMPSYKKCTCMQKIVDVLKNPKPFEDIMKTPIPGKIFANQNGTFVFDNFECQKRKITACVPIQSRMPRLNKWLKNKYRGFSGFTRFMVAKEDNLLFERSLRFTENYGHMKIFGMGECQVENHWLRKFFSQMSIFMDANLVIPSVFTDLFVCKICDNIISFNIGLTCRHVFCAKCIEHCPENCPVCEAPVTSARHMRTVEDLIQAKYHNLRCAESHVNRANPYLFKKPSVETNEEVIRNAHEMAYNQEFFKEYEQDINNQPRVPFDFKRSVDYMHRWKHDDMFHKKRMKIYGTDYDHLVELSIFHRCFVQECLKKNDMDGIKMLDDKYKNMRWNSYLKGSYDGIRHPKYNVNTAKHTKNAELKDFLTLLHPHMML